MTDSLSWVATAATVLAASLTAANLGSRITGYGFIVFTLGSLAWLAVGSRSDQPALVWTNAILTILNLFGIWRWLGRQAKVEQGAMAAAEASERSPGEALFPVSLLSGAEVRSAATSLGASVDAMAGASSGRIAYVMISEGGLAGAGERLRPVLWNKVAVEGEELVLSLTEDQFLALEPVPRDRWPAFDG